MKKYIHKHLLNCSDAVVYTEIGPSPQGDIIFVWSCRGRERAVVLTPSYVENDMIEYKEPLKGTVWVNIYDNGGSTRHETRQLADVHPSIGWRIACVEVPWVEGQGMEKSCSCLNKNRCECN